MYGYWPDGEVDITICETTFAITGHQQRWVDLITHALREWEESLDGLLTITVITGACELDSNMARKKRSGENNTNEIFMVTRTDYDESIFDILTAPWKSPVEERFDIILREDTASRVATEEETDGDGGPAFDIGRNGKSIDMLLQYEKMNTLSREMMPRIPGVNSEWK